MDSVFPLLNSAELPPYIWGSDEREKVKAWLNLSQDIFLAITYLLNARIMKYNANSTRDVEGTRKPILRLLTRKRFYGCWNVCNITRVCMEIMGH